MTNRKDKPKKPRKRRRTQPYLEMEDGNQLLPGGIRRHRAGGGYRIVKKVLPR